MHSENDPNCLDCDVLQGDAGTHRGRLQAATIGLALAVKRLAQNHSLAPEMDSRGGRRGCCPAASRQSAGVIRAGHRVGPRLPTRFGADVDMNLVMMEKDASSKFKHRGGGDVRPMGSSQKC